MKIREGHKQNHIYKTTNVLSKQNVVVSVRMSDCPESKTVIKSYDRA